MSGKTSGGRLDGATAFKLYDTFGFPIDLTRIFSAAMAGRLILTGSTLAMEEQKATARRAWSGSGDSTTETIWLDLSQTLEPTEFLGYSSDTAEAVVTALVVDNAEIESLGKGGNAYMLVNQTPFYAESGGQVGDVGTVSWDGGSARITDTKRIIPSGIFVHHIDIDSGTLVKGQDVRLQIDVARRLRLRANHSATHLLHEALRLVLGDHVAQKGSLVSPDRLRFDFSHQKAVSADELDQVQQIVNERIRMNSDVTTRIMTPDAAIELGALALFGEKYGDEVRVVQMGGMVADDPTKLGRLNCAAAHM